MTQQPARKRLLPAIAIGLCMLTVLLGSVFLLRNFLGKEEEPSRKLVQEVRIIRPPPPPETEPPPPPPPEEEVDVPEPVDEPEPTPSDEPPPGDQLGVDSEGTGAGDGFGLVGRPGGRDLLASGGSAFSWYAGLIKDEILNRLDDVHKVRSGSYSVVVRLWVGHDGTVERAALVSSTGDKERDVAIESALSRLTRLSRGPPADMPQPISLRIVSRV